jgi:hypothetical protein
VHILASCCCCCCCCCHRGCCCCCCCRCQPASLSACLSACLPVCLCRCKTRSRGQLESPALNHRLESRTGPAGPAPAVRRAPPPPRQQQLLSLLARRAGQHLGALRDQVFVAESRPSIIVCLGRLAGAPKVNVGPCELSAPSVAAPAAGPSVSTRANNNDDDADEDDDVNRIRTAGANAKKTIVRPPAGRDGPNVNRAKRTTRWPANNNNEPSNLLLGRTCLLRVFVKDFIVRPTSEGDDSGCHRRRRRRARI